MFDKVIIRRLLLAPPAFRSTFLQSTIRYIQPLSSLRYSSQLQSVTQSSFWASLIPKPLRRTQALSANTKKPKSKEWNPYTFFIIIFLLIGSMSIQMIALRNEFAAFSRRADAKIDLLREIIERVQKGEEVEVEGLLGTGDPEKEKEWEEVLKEIEKEDELWAESRRKRPRRGAITQANAQSATDIEANSKGNDTKDEETTKSKGKSNAPPGFY